MPKVVDHVERRRQIVASVWSLIGRKGLEAVTMRELAAEAGYANGALAPYFRNKDEILQAAFQHAFDSTDARAREAIGDSGGLTALRRLCREIMPLDDVRLLEARVVVAFWDRALHDPGMAGVFRSAIAQWHDQLRFHLLQARAAGEATTDTPDSVVADALMTWLIGIQARALLTPDLPADRQEQLLDATLSALGYQL
ncbi:TetR/AcrR family transcriptional regulator [Streptomyces olivaceus]|uniref:TetR/AcrR family transcriptional regulator n=1 Tax=Streptomyces olivaceus TaxID=47716 RepID=UPI001CCC00F2|nr:TetR/AcrR family transcriptional regulator [Streptomyces olivaceus]MBZ6083713.1 TetR/AcrR family transcriptional regulator [Streptomyces olivaceus]